MNVKVEDIEKNVVQLEIEVDAEKFQEGMKKSFRKNAKKFNISGFRKGKAPMNVVVRYHGEQVLYEDAINIVCPDAFEEAVKLKDINPVDKPEIDIKQIGLGENLIFTTKVTVKPEVELGEYKGVEIEKVKADVTDEDVEKELEKVVEKNARLITVEDRGIEQGDTVNMDFEGFVDGTVFDGGKASGHDLVIGSGQFIPGFEEQLIGGKTGDDMEINATFPEDYGKAELAGKDAQFKVKVNGIKVKELPVVDDEFAIDVSEFDTLAEYKEDLKTKLIETAQKKAKDETESKVVDKAVENSEIDIPQVMIENQIDRLVYDFDMRMRYQGIDLQSYLSVSNIKMDEFRKQFTEGAQKQVKTQLVIEKIKDTENIAVSDEDVDNEIKRLAETYKQSEEEFRKKLRDEDIDSIKEDLVIKNAVKFLVENASIV